MPYSCTFENCSNPNERYGTRRKWYQHELNEHRRVWLCKLEQCVSVRFGTQEALREHLLTAHVDFRDFDAHSFEFVLRSCEEALPLDALQECSICLREFPSQRLRKHLGKHMEQLALWILPRDDNSDNTSSENSDKDDESEDGKSSRDAASEGGDVDGSEDGQSSHNAASEERDDENKLIKARNRDLGSDVKKHSPAMDTSFVERDTVVSVTKNLIRHLFESTTESAVGLEMEQSVLAGLKRLDPDTVKSTTELLELKLETARHLQYEPIAIEAIADEHPTLPAPRYLGQIIEDHGEDTLAKALTEWSGRSKLSFAKLNQMADSLKDSDNGVRRVVASAISNLLRSHPDAFVDILHDAFYSPSQRAFPAVFHFKSALNSLLELEQKLYAHTGCDLRSQLVTIMEGVAVKCHKYEKDIWLGFFIAFPVEITAEVIQKLWQENVFQMREVTAFRQSVIDPQVIEQKGYRYIQDKFHIVVLQELTPFAIKDLIDESSDVHPPKPGGFFSCRRCTTRIFRKHLPGPGGRWELCYECGLKYIIDVSLPNRFTVPEQESIAGCSQCL